MTTTKHVKPEEGRTIIDPYSGRRLPADGAIVPWNTFWKKRVAEGHCFIVEPKKKAAPKTKVKTEDN